MRPRRAVITGLGVVSAGGCDPHSLWAGLARGRSAVTTIGRFDPSAYPSRIAAEVAETALPCREDLPRDLEDWGRIARYGFLAAAQAIDDACLVRTGGERAAVGVSLAAGLGSYDHEEVFGPCGSARASSGDDFDWAAFTATLRETLKPRATERRTPGSIASLIARHYGFEGPVMSAMTACAGGAQGIGDAWRWIRSGRADVVIAGGADSELYPMGLASFCLLGALSRRNDDPTAASRPFDAARDGFVLGEGAGVLVLEEYDHARRRGARVYAEVAGFGSACDAFRVTDPHPEGAGAILAMRRALESASIGIDEVDYINAHGTSTIANDRVETLAIKRVFGERAGRIPVSSTKSMLGHATVAAGAIEAVVGVLTLTHQLIHPTINLQHPDPSCDLDCVPGRARHARIDQVLSNSFAFGGQAASLVLGRVDA